MYTHIYISENLPLRTLAIQYRADVYNHAILRTGRARLVNTAYIREFDLET